MNHFAVYQKLTRHFKSTIPQYKNYNKLITHYNHIELFVGIQGYISIRKYSDIILSMYYRKNTTISINNQNCI